MRKLLLLMIAIGLTACGQTDLSAYFEDHGDNATMLIYDSSQDREYVYNEDRAEEAFLPASTFKVPHAMIALSEEVWGQEPYAMAWDGTEYPFASWNRDQTLNTAISNSVVWYFEETARRIGPGRMQYHLDQLSYGNRSMGIPSDRFWLEGSLRITAREQLDFLRKLEQGDLPFDEEIQNRVKEALIIEKGASFVLRGKTGTAIDQATQEYISWFIGWIERPQGPVFFVLNLSGPLEEKQFGEARELSMTILEDLGYFQE